MRAYVVLIICLAALAAAACGADGPPSAADLAPIRQPAPDAPGQAEEPQPTPNEPQAGHSEEAALQSAAEPAEQPARARVPTVRPNLIMRLTRPLSIYAWPGEDWLPILTYGPRTLLLADGWTLSAAGELWLHLDLNGERDGWARQAKSPLSPEEAQSLPQLSSPDLPTAQLDGQDGSRLTLSLLGRSADAAQIAVRFAGEQVVMWADRREFEDDADLDRLPVYTGSTAGRWEPWRRPAGDALEVAVHAWNAESAAWPSGPRLGWRLRTGRYPLLGRSLDSDWLALRVDALEPPVVWLRADRLNLKVDLESLPVFLSMGLELITLDREGRAASSRFAPELMRFRGWRADHELLLVLPGKGTWLWNLQSDELSRVTDLALANISPDGGYAVARWPDDASVPDDGSQALNVALVSLEDGEVLHFCCVYRPWGTDAPGFQQYWSADSRWLLTTVYRYREETDRTRHFALSVTGERIELVPPEGEWIPHWQALLRLEQAGIQVLYLNEEGEQIPRPWAEEVFEPEAPRAEPYPELSEGWYPRYPRAWSPDGRLLIAARTRWTDAVDERGLAALPAQGERWAIYEIGIFDRTGQLRQLLRGFGPECGQWRSAASWSPDGESILFEPLWQSCA